MLALSCVCTALLYGACAGAALGSEASIGFDDLSAGTLVSDQYAMQGLQLGSASSFGQTPPADGDCGSPSVEVESAATPAVSAPNYALLPACPSAGPFFSGTYGAFSHPASSVAVQVRASLAAPAPSEVLLVGYDASGAEVASGHGEAGAGAWQPISIGGENAQISYISIRTAGVGESPIAIDDLSFVGQGEEPGGPGGSGGEGPGAGAGGGSSGSQEGSTAPKPPTAALALSGTAVAGGLTSFTGAGSSPGDGSIISYDWDFNDDGRIDTSTGTNPVAQLALPPGQHTVALTVTNSNGEKATSKLGVMIPAPSTLQLPDGGEGPCEPSYEHEQIEILAECIQTLPGGGYVISTRQLDLNGMMLVPEGGGKGIFKIQTVQRLGVGTYTLLSGSNVSFELLNTPIGNVVLGGRDLETEPIQLGVHVFVPPKVQLALAQAPARTAANESKKSLILSFAVGTECSATQKAATCCPKRQNTSCETLPGGFPIGGQVNAYVGNKGEILLTVQVALDLSAVNLQATGALEISADVNTGINLDSLQFTIPEAGLAEVFKIEKASFTYYFPDDPETSKQDTWQAKATIVFGPLGEPKMEGSLAFKKGQFHEASMLFTAPTGTGVPIYPGVLVNQLGGTIGVEPLKFGGTIGASIATQLELSLSFLYREAEGEELGFFGGQGKLSFKNDEIATLAADVYSDGYTDAQLKLDLHFPFDSKEPAIEVGGEIGFWDEPKYGHWEADGNVHMKLWIINAEVAGLVNNEKAAGCLSAFGGGLQGSYAFANGEIKGGAFIAKDCSDELKQYKEVQVEKHSGGFVKFEALQPGPLGAHRLTASPWAHASATGAETISVPSGQYGDELLIEARSGTPIVTLTSPNGKHSFTTPTTPSTADGLDGQFIAAVAPNPHQVIVLLEHPEGGRWQIEPTAGGPAIAKVQGATDVPPASIHARVRHRHGHGLALSYRIANFVQGMKVQFVERGRDSTQVIGTASKPNGTFAFSPQEGLSRPRRLYADIFGATGSAKRPMLVGHFRAPAAQRGGRVRGLRLVRHGSTALLSWRTTPGAQGYKVTVEGSDGRLITRFPRRGQRSVKLGEAFPWYSYRAQVSAEAGKNMLPGPAAKASLKASGHSPGRPPKASRVKHRKAGRHGQLKRRRR
ncbi:MAG TPA: PKD domain-containing protein [Solirubrobacteraceae bacterium]